MQQVGEMTFPLLFWVNKTAILFESFILFLRNVVRKKYDSDILSARNDYYRVLQWHILEGRQETVF